MTLAAAGASVAATGRRLDRLEEVAKEITARGGTAVPVQLDQTDAGQIVAAVDTAEAAFGTVTILVNNAGIPDAQRAVRMSVELIDQVIGTNLRGPYILACEVAKRLIAATAAGPHGERVVDGRVPLRRRRRRPRTPSPRRR